MSNRELTNAEVNFIDDVVRRLGGGALLRCELLTLAFYVKQSGDDRERDQLARFFRGEIEPNGDYNDDGTAMFVETLSDAAKIELAEKVAAAAVREVMP